MSCGIVFVDGENRAKRTNAAPLLRPASVQKWYFRLMLTPHNWLSGVMTS